jgi:hypothetical protein
VENLKGRATGGGATGTCMDTIKIDFKGKECEIVNWIHVTLDRDQWRDFVNIVMNYWVP